MRKLLNLESFFLFIFFDYVDYITVLQKISTGVLFDNTAGYGKIRQMAKNATLKQVTALKLISQGYSKRQAMLKAGYSAGSADHPSSRLLQRVSTQEMLDDFRDILVKEGLTAAYMANKFKEWLNAGKSNGNPDYTTQIRCYDRWKDILEREESPENHGKIKRRISFEEWITGDENNNSQESKT